MHGLCKPVDMDMVCVLRAQGLQGKQIASTMGICLSRLYKYAQAAGLSFRKRPRCPNGHDKTKTENLDTRGHCEICRKNSSDKSSQHRTERRLRWRQQYAARHGVGLATRQTAGPSWTWSDLADELEREEVMPVHLRGRAARIRAFLVFNKIKNT